MAALRIAPASWLLGLVFALLTFTPGFIAGTGPYWQFPQGDAATAQIGWQYYARDDWRWPVFSVDNYHAPEGSTVLLSDSLPLFALPAKLLYKATGWLVVYTGFWVALCLVLQAVCAWRLLRALGVDDWIVLSGGSLLFCYMPLLLLRLGHATLMGHFLLLVALERYVTAKRAGLSAPGWLGLCALPVIAVHTHPYMAAMCSALVFATVVDQWLDRRIDARGAALRLGGSAAATAAIALLGGLFRGGGQPFDDYGLYSLNLLAPFVPLDNSLLGRWLHTAQPNVPGLMQSEGLCYLGAGILALCAAASPALRQLGANLRRHRVLAGTLLALLVFAVSNRVGVGPAEVAHLPLPDAVIHVLSVFRGSGRFVWPAVYALLAAVIASLAHRHGARRAALIVACGAVLQIVDVRPMQVAIRSVSASGASTAIDRAKWTPLVGAAPSLFEFPSFECGGLFGNGVPGDRFRELGIDFIAASAGKPTNSAYLARALKDCDRERRDVPAKNREPGVLNLYRSSEDVGEFLQRSGVDLARCGYLDDVVVCSDADLSGLR